MPGPRPHPDLDLALGDLLALEANAIRTRDLALLRVFAGLALCALALRSLVLRSLARRLQARAIVHVLVVVVLALVKFVNQTLFILYPLVVLLFAVGLVAPD